MLVFDWSQQDISSPKYGGQTRDKSLKLCGGYLQAVEETSQRREQLEWSG